MSDKITLFYAVTPDRPYPRYAAQSIYSAVRANPGIRVRLVEVDGGDYPEAVHIQGLPVNTEDATEWAVILDADCWVNGNLEELLTGAKDINLRIAHAWTTGQINHREWWDICDSYGLPHVPVYSNGLILCRWHIAARLRAALPGWIHGMDVISRYGGLPDPLHISKRPEWWMRDQYALSLLCALWGGGGSVGELTAEHISWNYARESGGIVHHVGKKFDPFTEKQWPRYMAKT